MNSSRAMLLAALMFAAPVFADNDLNQNDASGQIIDQKLPENNTNQDKNKSPENNTPTPVVENPTWFAAKLAVLTGAASTVASYTVAPVANWTAVPVLNQFLRISYLKGGKFEANIPTIGNTMVAAAAVYGAIAAYNAINNQDVDGDDSEEFFTE
jgi:hypothetical protein